MTTHDTNEHDLIARVVTAFEQMPIPQGPSTQQTIELLRSDSRRLNTSHAADSSRRRLARIAAPVGAALAVCVVLLLWWPPAPVAALTLADMADAVRERPWIKGSWDRGNKTLEQWSSRRHRITATRWGREIQMKDELCGVGYSYDPDTNVLNRVLLPSQTDRTRKSKNWILWILREIERGEESLDLSLPNREVQRQHRRNVNEGDREWIEYELTVRWKTTGMSYRSVFRVDPKTRLLHSFQTHSLTGTPRDQLWSFEYPDNGPLDPYVLGVPRNAKVVDSISVERKSKDIDATQAIREALSKRLRRRDEQVD